MNTAKKNTMMTITTALMIAPAIAGLLLCLNNPMIDKILLMAMPNNPTVNNLLLRDSKLHINMIEMMDIQMLNVP